METEFPWPHVRSLGRPQALLGDVRIFMAAVGGLVPTDGKLKSARCIPQNTAALETIACCCCAGRYAQYRYTGPATFQVWRGFLTTWNPPRSPPRRRASCRSRWCPPPRGSSPASAVPLVDGPWLPRALCPKVEWNFLIFIIVIIVALANPMVRALELCCEFTPPVLGVSRHPILRVRSATSQSSFSP